MKKIKSSLENIVNDIKSFYDEKKWHFMTLNGVCISDEIIEIQWMFSKYEALDDVSVYYIEANYTDTIPSIVDIVPSAIISQREIVDMFGLHVEDSESGLYLEKDSKQAPLVGCGI
jgi:Ni,Fe-hydrogenase III component G